jgi:hypothetical protein
MKLTDVLSEKKAAIGERWFESILETYPPDTQRFLKTHKEKFTNPVGSTVREAVEGILKELIARLGGQGSDFQEGRVPSYLDNIIRIRAVQGFTASRAVSFVLALKGVVRRELSRQEAAEVSGQLADLDAMVDELMLMAFDVYMNCREKIYEIRANELSRRTFRLLQKGGAIRGAEGGKPGAVGNKKKKEVDE